MDIKIIINSFIIIFILHIIIININYSYSIGKKTKIENFDDSINFLTNYEENDDFKKKLLKYIQEDEKEKETPFENKNLLKVEASNSYVSDNNVPNFESNVADISKFYKVSYDNLDEDQLKSTSIEKCRNDVEKETKVPCDIKPYGRESTANPDNWEYKNEIPMNGGAMNGIFGFDSLESQFASYNPNKLNLQNVNENKFQNIPHDDLRKPIIYEN